jgi:hypothetical protein
VSVWPTVGFDRPSGLVWPRLGLPCLPVRQCAGTEWTTHCSNSGYADRHFMHAIHPHPTQSQQPPRGPDSKIVPSQYACTYLTWLSKTHDPANCRYRERWLAALQPMGWSAFVETCWWRVRWEERSRRAIPKMTTSDSCLESRLHFITISTSQHSLVHKLSNHHGQVKYIDTLYTLSTLSIRSKVTNNFE